MNPCSGTHPSFQSGRSCIQSKQCLVGSRTLSAKDSTPQLKARCPVQAAACCSCCCSSAASQALANSCTRDSCATRSQMVSKSLCTAAQPGISSLAISAVPLPLIYCLFTAGRYPHNWPADGPKHVAPGAHALVPVEQHLAQSCGRSAAGRAANQCAAVLHSGQPQCSGPQWQWNGTRSTALRRLPLSRLHMDMHWALPSGE
jgi:hypothetical protein